MYADMETSEKYWKVQRKSTHDNMEIIPVSVSLYFFPGFQCL